MGQHAVTLAVQHIEGMRADCLDRWKNRRSHQAGRGEDRWYSVTGFRRVCFYRGMFRSEADIQPDTGSVKPGSGVLVPLELCWAHSWAVRQAKAGAPAELIARQLGLEAPARTLRVDSRVLEKAEIGEAAGTDKDYEAAGCGRSLAAAAIPSDRKDRLSGLEREELLPGAHAEMVAEFDLTSQTVTLRLTEDDQLDELVGSP